MDLVCGIDGDKNGTDFCGRPECDIPGRHVGCPDCNFGTGLDAERNKSSCEVVDIFAEFFICSCIVKGCVFETILIGKLLDQSVENLRKCQIDQFIFLPDIFTCSVMIQIEMGTV